MALVAVAEEFRVPGSAKTLMFYLNGELFTSFTEILGDKGEFKMSRKGRFKATNEQLTEDFTSSSRRRSNSFYYGQKLQWIKSYPNDERSRPKEILIG